MKKNRGNHKAEMRIEEKVEAKSSNEEMRTDARFATWTHPPPETSILAS